MEQPEPRAAAPRSNTNQIFGAMGFGDEIRRLLINVDPLPPNDAELQFAGARPRESTESP